MPRESRSLLTEQIGPTPAAGDDAPRVSWRSAVGLNAANFFLAEVTGVTLPFVAAYLKDQHFSPFTIGLALTVAGLGVFLAQAPAASSPTASSSASSYWPARRPCWASVTALSLLSRRRRSPSTRCYSSRASPNRSFCPSWGAGARAGRAPGAEPDDGLEPGLEPRRQSRRRPVRPGAGLPVRVVGPGLLCGAGVYPSWRRPRPSSSAATS